MNNYIMTITIISVASAFIYTASPENTRKYISLISSLIIILIVVLPLKNGIGSDNEWNLANKHESEFTQMDKNEQAAECLAKSISSTISDMFNINIKRIIVQTKDTSTFDVYTVKVFADTGIIDTDIISKKVADLYNCKIEIYQGE